MRKSHMTTLVTVPESVVHGECKDGMIGQVVLERLVACRVENFETFSFVQHQFLFGDEFFASALWAHGAQIAAPDAWVDDTYGLLIVSDTDCVREFRRRLAQNQDTWLLCFGLKMWRT